MHWCFSIFLILVRNSLAYENYFGTSLRFSETRFPLKVVQIVVLFHKHTLVVEANLTHCSRVDLKRNPEALPFPLYQVIMERFCAGMILKLLL